MHNVLAASESGEPQIHTLIFDEKPGIQAIGTTTPDLPPTEENGVTKRDCEYKRFGSSSAPRGNRSSNGQGSSRL